jgi:hypothetical protein
MAGFDQIFRMGKWSQTGRRTPREEKQLADICGFLYLRAAWEATPSRA